VVTARYVYRFVPVEQEPILRVAQINPLNAELIMPASMLGLACYGANPFDTTRSGLRRKAAILTDSIWSFLT